MRNPYFIIDFDSTFTQVEALDVLAGIVLAHSPRREEVVRAIQEITDLGMNGELDFRESLIRRLNLLRAHREDIHRLAEDLKALISPSFQRNRKHLAALRDTVYVVSNGFREFIVPVVESYGLLAQNVYANTFRFDESGLITGFDTENPLSRSGGKPTVIRDLQLQGDVYVIGDGANDLEIWKAGYANKFYLFTENVEREKVRQEADHAAATVDEILYELNLARSLSYPKTRIRVLLLEGVGPQAVAAFEEEGYQVEVAPPGLTDRELAARLPQVNILGLSSRRTVTEDMLRHTRRLISIGVFSSDASRINLEACSRRGIAVFNAPFSHVRPVCEFTMGNILWLSRGREGSPGRQIRGKVLGIIGYGKIGAQLGLMAESLGMDVLFYDIDDRVPLGNHRKCTQLGELLQRADFVSIHISDSPANYRMFSDATFQALRPDSSVLYSGNAEAVDLDALLRHLQAHPNAGCALDLHADRLSQDSRATLEEVRRFGRVLFTPGISALTEEAEEDRAAFIPAKINEYLNTGNTMGSLNFPNIFLPSLKNAHRLLHIHQNVPNVLARINQIFAAHRINILAQSLQTSGPVGYVVTDVDLQYPEALLDEMRGIGETIWFRVLY